jgi:hypothetical protein
MSRKSTVREDPLWSRRNNRVLRMRCNYTSGEVVSSTRALVFKLNFCLALLSSALMQRYIVKNFYFTLHYVQNVFEGTLATFLSTRKISRQSSLPQNMLGSLNCMVTNIGEREAAREASTSAEFASVLLKVSALHVHIHLSQQRQSSKP